MSVVAMIAVVSLFQVAQTGDVNGWHNLTLGMTPFRIGELYKVKPQSGTPPDRATAWWVVDETVASRGRQFRVTLHFDDVVMIDSIYLSEENREDGFLRPTNAKLDGITLVLLNNDSPSACSDLQALRSAAREQYGKEASVTGVSEDTTLRWSFPSAALTLTQRIVHHASINQNYCYFEFTYRRRQKTFGP